MRLGEQSWCPAQDCLPFKCSVFPASLQMLSVWSWPGPTSLQMLSVSMRLIAECQDWSVSSTPGEQQRIVSCNQTIAFEYRKVPSFTCWAFEWRNPSNTMHKQQTTTGLMWCEGNVVRAKTKHDMQKELQFVCMHPRPHTSHHTRLCYGGETTWMHQATTNKTKCASK